MRNDVKGLICKKQFVKDNLDRFDFILANDLIRDLKAEREKLEKEKIRTEE